MKANFWIFLMISLMAHQVPVFPQVVLHISNHMISDISRLYCFEKANEASPQSTNDQILRKLIMGCSHKFECNSKTLKIIICKCVWTCEIKFETHSRQYKKGVLPRKVKASVLVFSPSFRVTSAVSPLSWTLISPGESQKGEAAFYSEITTSSPLRSVVSACLMAN